MTPETCCQVKRQGKLTCPQHAPQAAGGPGLAQEAQMSRRGQAIVALSPEEVHDIISDGGQGIPGHSCCPAVDCLLGVFRGLSQASVAPGVQSRQHIPHCPLCQSSHLHISLGQMSQGEVCFSNESAATTNQSSDACVKQACGSSPSVPSGS